MENQQINGGSIIKLQKPNEDTFINIVSKNGKQYGDCTVCNCIDIEVDEHFCQSVIDSDGLDMTNIYDTDPLITSIDEFRKLLESKEIVEFNDGQIKYYKKLFSMQHVKYRKNKFFISLMTQLENKKQLSKSQLENLSYLIKNGKSMYDAGILSTKN